MQAFGCKNFRKFKNLPMMDLGGINIFVGTNNSGKSTAIKALMLTLLNAKRKQSNMLKYESEKSMLPPFMYMFDFAFEVLEHLYLGDFKSALNFNSDDKNICFSFFNGSTFFSFTCTSQNDRLPSAYFVKSEIVNERSGTKYTYNYLFKPHQNGRLPQYGTVTCEFSIPEEEEKDFKHAIDEQICKYEKLISERHSDKIRRELEQYQICRETYNNGGRTFCLTYSFFRQSQTPDIKDVTPHHPYLKDLFTRKNKIITHDFKSLPSIQYIETHNASHKLLLDKEDKNNYLAQTIFIYLRNTGGADHYNESSFICKWMKEFGVGSSLEIEDVYGEAYRINIIESDGRSVPLAHKGTGTIQLINLLMRLACYGAGDLGKDNVIIVIEEPEQNMHPALQSKLADLFYEVWKNKGGKVRFVVETHSEYLVRRLQVIAAQEIERGNYTTDEINDNIKVVYFPVNKDPYPMDFDDYGYFIRDFDRGFFDEAGRSYRELVRIERGIQ